MHFYASDIMSDTLITVRPEMSCEAVMELFLAERISGAPVLDKDGALVGVITLTDIVQSGLNYPYSSGYFENAVIDRIMSQEGFHVENVNIGYVSDFMTRHVHTAYPDTPVPELAKTMYRNHIHRIIIVNPLNDMPIGVVSTFDLLKLMAETGSVSELEVG